MQPSILEYDESPDGRIGVWDWMWKLGSLSGKGEVCEELRIRLIDVCCLQEVLEYLG